MTIYAVKVPMLEANQWFRNGDHPDDRTINRINTGRIVIRSEYNNRSIPVCELCNKPLFEHGRINPSLAINTLPEENSVCPGDYIITHRFANNRVAGYSIYKQAEFEKHYEPYKEPKQ